MTRNLFNRNNAISSLAISAMALGSIAMSTTPAMAANSTARASLGSSTASLTQTVQQRRDHDKGISAGEVIAGALVIGGIAAIIASSNNDKDRYRDDRYYDSRYNGSYNNSYYNGGVRAPNGAYNNGYNGYNNGRISSREAVNRCVNAANAQASHYGRHARVIDVRDIDRTRNGYRVKGTVEVRNGGRRGYTDRGSFRCNVDYGRVNNVHISGIR